jgi:TorA maturation chaperone TorD
MALAAAADRLSDVTDRISAEDDTRTQLYRLLASLFSAAPSANLLKSLSSLTGDDGRFGQSISTLAKVAAVTSEATARSEYQELFIGLGRGELVPYGSYYQTGFLQEKPLANLRRDMMRLGITRSNDTSDPEDHVASVLEMMAGLIDGRFGEPGDLTVQKDFYLRHLASWLPIFFRDLEGAQASVFYAATGSMGRAFLEIESGAFDMV